MSEIALIGRKIGMSREFYKTGQSIPVTVLKLETGIKHYKLVLEKLKIQN